MEATEAATFEKVAAAAMAGQVESALLGEVLSVGGGGLTLDALSEFSFKDVGRAAAAKGKDIGECVRAFFATLRDALPAVESGKLHLLSKFITLLTLFTFLLTAWDIDHERRRQEKAAKAIADQQAADKLAKEQAEQRQPEHFVAALRKYNKILIFFY